MVLSVSGRGTLKGLSAPELLSSAHQLSKILLIKIMCMVLCGIGESVNLDELSS